MTVGFDPAHGGGGVVLDLLLIGLGITLEPFPVTAFILVLTAEKGTIKGLAYILGWLACLAAVIAAVVLATGNSPPRPQTVPSTAALAVKLALGIVLILIAVRQRRRMGRPRKPSSWTAHLDRLSPWADWTPAGAAPMSHRAGEGRGWCGTHECREACGTWVARPRATGPT